MASRIGNYFMIVVLFAAAYTIWNSSLRVQFTIPLIAAGVVCLGGSWLLKKKGLANETSEGLLAVAAIMVVLFLPKSLYSNIKFSTLDYVYSGNVALNPTLTTVLLLAAGCYLAYQTGLLKGLFKELGLHL